MFNKYLTRKLAAKACVFVICLNCTRTCIPLVWTSLLVGSCPFMCEKHIHCFFLVVAASSNCICWRFRPEMSRGAAHAFLYGVYCNWWFPGTGACPVSIVSCIALIPCHRELGIFGRGDFGASGIFRNFVNLFEDFQKNISENPKKFTYFLEKVFCRNIEWDFFQKYREILVISKFLKFFWTFSMIF